MDYLMVLVGPEKPMRQTVDKVEAKKIIRMVLDRGKRHQSSKYLAKKMVREMDDGGVVSLRNNMGDGTLLAGRVDKEAMLNSILNDILASRNASVH